MPTFLQSLSNVFVRMADALRIDTGRIIGSPAGLPGERVPFATVEKLGYAILDRSGDPAVGLTAASCWHPADLGAFGYSWFSSESLHAGLKRLVRYSKVLNSHQTLTLKETGDVLRLALTTHFRPFPPDRVRYFLNDVHSALTVALCRKNFGPGFAPVRVGLTRPRPENTAPYFQFFACPVEFGADVNFLDIQRAVADMALPTANHALVATFDEMLCRELARLDASDIVTVTKAMLIKTLVDGNPHDGDIASQLFMSRRTFQRRLAERGTNFSRLVDEVRRDLAMKYLADPHHSVTAITYLTGFSTPSAFTRAFMRWTGTTPSAWRENLASAAKKTSDSAAVPTAIDGVRPVA